MKYLNGSDIFPEKLLRQIQKYASGQLVYIPAGNTKKSWGETSGYKRYLAERNLEIRRAFREGADIDDLAARYFLSPETIKKIAYAKKELTIMEYRCTLESACEYARAGKLEEWMHIYLLSDGHNKEFSDGLKLFDRYFLGPVNMPLSLFPRCCGPEEDMKYRMDAVWFEQHVRQLMDVIQSGADMPPLIVHYVDGNFELNDGNHRHEAYVRLNITEYPVIIWITEEEELAEFREKYGQYLTATSGS